MRAEQDYLALVRSCLAEMVRTTEAFRPVGGDKLATEQLEKNRLRRLAALDIPGDVPLFFGRIDIAEPPQSFHVGRRHIRDSARDPVVVDWRADIARAFYRASRRDPLGLSRRRRFGFQQGQITSFEDEVLQGQDPAQHLQAEGLSPLVAAEIERPRTGPMRDIVATIQPEQDELVRAPLDDSICVQGGPGTGKTAVGLHRAAYLLFAYEAQLRRAGVLVVGPNQAFVHYINQVLPALGEVDVEQTPLDDLLGSVRVRGSDAPAAASLKHDARMAEVIRQAIAARMVLPAGPLAVRVGLTTLRLQPEDLQRARQSALRRGDPYEAGRQVFRRLVTDQLLVRAELTIGGVERAHVTRGLRETTGAEELLAGMWPKQEAVAVVRSLLEDAEALAGAAAGILDEHEQHLLHRPRPTGRAPLAWTSADLVLIDEAAGVIARPRTYGHVVLDEAQDLSPMQLRAVGRRCGRSVTLLGDLAQGTTPWCSPSWPAALGHLGVLARTEHLTRAFRLPGSVLAMANRLLAMIAPGLPPAVAVRGASDALEVEQAEVSRLPQAVAAKVAQALAHPGTVGVIVPDDLWQAVRQALERRSIAPGAPDDVAAGQQVILLRAGEAKGMEFDSVVLVEPAAITQGDSPVALRHLYIALTRAVVRLAIVHATPLPVSLTG